MTQSVTTQRSAFVAFASLAGLSILLASSPASAAHRHPGMGHPHGHRPGGFHGHPRQFHGHPNRGGGFRFGHPHGGYAHRPHGHFEVRPGARFGGGRPSIGFGGHRPRYGYGGYGGGFAVYGHPAPYGIVPGCSVSRHVGFTPWGWHKIVTTKVCYVP